ncbi:MAG: flavodoxin family protein [Halanaeroarchaeum sp.]
MSDDTDRWPGTGGAPPRVRDEVVLTYYSRTGTTARVAADLAARFADPTVQRIRPDRERRYANWLARSFVPGSTVPIEGVETDLREASALVLGSPKWTLSCPPVTAFLERANLEGVPTALFLTYGGFDERRYLNRLVERVSDAGADVVATLLVKRDRVGSAEYEAALDEFVAAVRDERR